MCVPDGIESAIDAPHLIRAAGLQLTYPNGTQALRSVDFTLRAGEVVALIGASGAGKSTLLRCIGGQLEPTVGSVHFAGDNVYATTRSARTTRTRCAMVFQNFGLVPRLSALTNVLIGGAGRTPMWRGALYLFRTGERQGALHALKRVGLLEQWNRRPAQLSGGQQQRVAVARALHQQPAVLLADEPVSSLDPITARSVLEHAVSLCRAEGIAMVVNLHDVALAREYADRIVALRDGRVVYEGTAEGLGDAALKEIYEAQ